jgi:hypothetical protein
VTFLMAVESGNATFLVGLGKRFFDFPCAAGKAETQLSFWVALAGDLIGARCLVRGRLSP